MLLLILLLPNIFLFINGNDINIFLLSIFLLIYIYSVVKSTKYLSLLFIFFMLVPFYLYYILNYGALFDEQILGIVLETHWQELSNFLGEKLFIYLIIFLFWILFCCLILYRNYKKPMIWKGTSRLWVSFLGTVYFILVTSLNQSDAIKVDENFKDINDNFLVNEKNNFIQDIKKTYPFGLFVALYDFYNEQKKINTAFEKNKNFKFNVEPRFNKNAQLVILVIGETSRRKNWQLNQYYRDTNPKLSMQESLVNFSQFLSISSETRSSVPMILTRKPAELVYRYNFPEKSIISLFKEAGFSTYWISTQQRFGAFDTSTSVYAKEANHIIFLNKASYSNQGDTDEILLPALKKVMLSPENKKFVVIHTLGSHYNYSHRYSKKFDIFRPSLNDVKKYSMQDKKYKTELLNSYDNSILYTDYFLNQVIEIIKKQENTESFLFYSSDHGEDLFDGGCDKSGHGNTTVYNYEIASFAWYSDLFKQKNPEKIVWLEMNKDRKINQTSIFPTLVDAANLNIPGDGLNKSLLKSFNDYSRLVNGGMDFDKIQPSGVCKEIQ